MSLVLDVFILLIVASNVFLTYKKGFVRSVLEFVSYVISIFLSNLLTPSVSEIYLPILTEQLNKTDTQFSEAAISLFSQALAFVTVFTVLSIVLRVLTVFISGIFKLPILNSLNKTLGLLLGCAKALLFVSLFVAIVQLSAPIINDIQAGLFSEEVIQNSYIFKHLYNIEWINFLVN